MTALRPILLSVMLAAMGQVVMKYAMSQTGRLVFSFRHLFPLLIKIFWNPWTIAGVACYVISMFFWLLALSKTDLSYAYPFTSLVFVIVMLASWLLFREPISWFRVMGILLISSGVVLVFKS